MESRFVRVLKLIYFLACMVYISGATFLTEIDWLLIPVAILGATCFYLKRLKLDKFIVLILLFFAVLNLASVAYNGDDEFHFVSFIGFYFRILIPYFLIKIYGDNFFIKYEKFVFYGALISLPLFLILIIDPFFYTKYFSEINMSGEIRESVGYWNFFVYTTHGGNNEIRNDGFAIEPGHFGYLLGVAIFFNLLFNKFKINRRLVIMLIAGITTLSTTFFMTLGLFLYLYFLNTNSNSFFTKLIVFVLFLGGNFFLINSSVVIDKIDKTKFAKENQLQYGVHNVEYGESMNRFGAFQVELNNIFHYPFGYGVNDTGKIHASDGEVVTGPNGVASFLSFWGISGAFFLFYSLIKLAKKTNVEIFNYRGLYVFPIIFLFYLFSNSISRDVLVFSLLFYPFINNSIKDKFILRSIERKNIDLVDREFKNNL